MNKHQIMEHNGEQPEFIFKLISSHKTALSRQIKESVRIRRRGGDSQILNSRSEFNRCHIPRLVVEEEDEDSREQRLKLEEQTKEEIAKIMEQEDITWEEKKKREQELLKKKRTADDHNQGGANPVNGGRKKRRKLNYAVLGEQWGEGADREEEDDGEPVVNVIETIQAPSPPPIKGRGGAKRQRAPTTLLNSSLITDYYQRLPKSMDSPLSPATLSFMVSSSAATDQEDRHQDQGSGMGKETQPQEDSLGNLSPATLSYMMDESMAADPGYRDDRHQDPRSSMGMKTKPNDESLCELSPTTLSYMMDESVAADPSHQDDRHQDLGSGMGMETQPNGDSLFELSPATLNYLMDESVAADPRPQDDRHQSSGSSMGMRTHPKDDSLGTLSPATLSFMMEESVAADHHHQRSGLGMEDIEPGMGMKCEEVEKNKDDIYEWNVEEDDLWNLLKIEDDIFEDGGSPVLSENVVQGRPVLRDSSTHGVGCGGDQPGGLEDKNRPDTSPVTSHTMTVPCHAIDAALATTNHVTLQGHDNYVRDDGFGRNKDDNTDHHGVGCSNSDGWKGVKDILVSGMARDTIRMPLTTPTTPVTPVGRKLQLSSDKHSTPINANILPLATAGFLDDTIGGEYQPTPHHPDHLDHPPPHGQVMVNQPTPPAHHPIPLKPKKCTYTGEVCDIHGEGALWRYKPIIVMVRGKKTRKGKDWFLVCDVNKDNKKLIQPKISSMISTRPNTTMEEGEGPGDKNNKNNQFSTSTVGQGND